MTLAQELFEEEIKYKVLEGKLLDELTKIYGEWEDCTFDYYDESLEVYGVKPLEDKSKLAYLGFKIVWEHPGKNRSECTSSPYCTCPPTRF